MPNRIIRDAILSSEKMAKLGWPEEVFYRRLMSIVDDYGRTEANPQLLRSRCYPLQTDAVRVTDISRWMAACQKAGLILCYDVQGKQYLEVGNFGQQQRSASKHPPPLSIDSKGKQMPADAHLVVFVDGDEGGDEGGDEKRERKRPPVFDPAEIDLPDWLRRESWQEWCADRKTRGKPITEVAAAKQVKKLGEYRDAGTDPHTVLDHAIASGHQGLFPPPKNPSTAPRVVTQSSVDKVAAAAKLLNFDDLEALNA